jgi:hypothetical protein
MHSHQGQYILYYINHQSINPLTSINHLTSINQTIGINDNMIQQEVIKALNSTFLVLIPKVNKPMSFGDYRPMALCNLCYKIIAKILANRIKHVLSRSLSGEQLGFLQGRQILDAIGTTQECLHSIKKKNLKALVLKLDLKKAYDCINWDFLRLILIQSGFRMMVTNWLMSCVISASYAVLINGETSIIFPERQRAETRVPTISFVIYFSDGRTQFIAKKRTGRRETDGFEGF